MDLNLKTKTVIVTAASKGLGKATAKQFAEEGANVVISSRSKEALQKTAAEIIEDTGNKNVMDQVCDITNPEDIKNLVNYTTETYGTVDVLINNAGGPPAGGIDQFTDEDWQNAYELNLLSFVRLIREVLPSMRKNKEGRIVKVASSSIKQTLDNLLLSNTFRAGIVGLSKSLSQELAQDGILINTVGPGRIGTDRVASLDEIRAEKLGISPDEVRQQAEASIPMGRYGQPDEFAKMVVSSEANTYITGQSFVVDGGLVKAL
ncbi:SDR family oxidoreductase [Salinibacillus aidingensis]|uniref:SDR family oxidoreductase n=1 Tax=Salinibacillus aidingensis TaxID=237684 RepID=A0ABN1AWF3_9BACI